MTKVQSRGLGIWGLLGIGLVILTIGLFALRARLQPEPLPVLGRVGTFALTNQLGQPISAEALRGNVWVANIIFTRCPGPCLLMTRSLAALQSRLADRDRVRLVSLTADPEHDTVGVMRSYAEGFGADAERWQFLTGSKAELYRLAMNDLKLTAEETDPARRENLNDLFIHSTTFVLVDAAGQVRGYFDGTDEAAPERLRGAIRRLQREH